MNTQLIIGPALLMLGFFVSAHGWRHRNDAPPPPSPKSGDMRIVERAIGGFAVERFHEYPSWEKWAEFGTLEEAQKCLERDRATDRVVAVQSN
jgi:hypothetical protein